MRFNTTHSFHSLVSKSLIKIFVIAVCMFGLLSCQKQKNHYRTWEIYQGDPGSNSYSELDQINRENVDQLKVSWIYNSGDKDLHRWRKSTSEANPIIVDGVMYLTTPALKTVALYASTGKQKWSFNPFPGQAPRGVNRGVVYWEDGNDKRILFSAGPNLIALNADNGQKISSFGEDGFVDLRKDLDRDPEQIAARSTSPGIVYKDLIIMGSSVTEGDGAAPGHIRAYNIRTGKLAWIFHTIPYPDEFGYNTWGKNAWITLGGANNWAGMSIDEERGIVYVPTGAPSPQIIGSGERKGDNLFGTTLLALDAATGERIWHYQMVHHDIWDYDLPAPPNLVTIQKDGQKIDAVVQATKQGFLFVLDRETGEPIFPIEERPVPQSNIEGHETSPTQPFPTKPVPFTRQHITEDDLTNISEEAYQHALKQFREFNYEGLFTPVSEKKTFFFPGTQGGAEWGGAAYDPETNILYINGNEFGNSFSLKKIESTVSDNPSDVGRHIFQTTCAICHGSSQEENVSEFPSLVNVHERLSDSEIRTIIENGVGRMPAFPQFDEEETDAILTYLENLEEESVEEISNNSNSNSYQYVVDTAYEKFTDPNGYPATKPPWGSLNAINLATGEMVWKIPLGEYEELTAQGIPPTGTHNLGGPIVTAGGLVFIAATKDEKFRAFDKETGELLWEYKLPAGGYATPSTYEIDGKQYVVIAATGGGNMDTPTSDTFIAFSLPDVE